MTTAVEQAGEARERCAALIRAGRALSHRPAEDVRAVLATVCARWRDPSDVARREGEQALALHHKVPASAIARVLDVGFAEWTEPSLARRAALELGDAGALDGFVEIGSARRMAVGPRLAAVIASRGVPTTPIGDAIDLLSVKAPVWIKPASGSDDLAARFARTLREVDAGVGAAIHVSEPWADPEASRVALAAADLVVATGRRGTLARIGDLVGSETRLELHGPRLSAAILTRRALEADPDACIDALADDAAFAGQAGCLSPVTAWVEDAEGDRLLEAIHRACTERWPAPPRGTMDAAERAAWAEWETLGDIERASGAAGRTVGGAANGWSVRWRARAEPPSPPPAPRILTLSPLGNASEAVDLCAQVRGAVAAVGIAGTDLEIERLAGPLALAGVERITALGRMQRPPLDWRRDGRATIADLVRWVDLEGGETKGPAADRDRPH